MMKMEVESSDSEDYNESDEELREAFARGDLKPGLNIELLKEKVEVNDVRGLLGKLDEIKLDLPWEERLDMINDLAPLAPELTLQFQKYEQKRANQFKGNAKMHYVSPESDPLLNDFKREMLFHRQAQAAVLEGFKRLEELGIPTLRPDDYFAEMAKSDEHMQKVRANLMAKQEGQAKSERIRQIREQRKMGKMLAKQTKVQREMEKKDMLDQLKKYRKGKLKNLDFLEDAKSNQQASTSKKKSGAKRKARDKEFGFGGKKRGLKRNTKASSAGLEPSTRGFLGNKGAKGVSKRPGKGKRQKAKAKGRN